jgi:class 3 adenylate cyclase
VSEIATSYARSGDVSIAYQVMGDGPFDIVFVPGFVSHVELEPKIQSWTPILRRYASAARLIRFDKRGTGMSDRTGSAPTLETRMDDVRAVMDACGSARAALFGVSEGAAMSLLFAATYPERTAALALRSGYPRTMWASDYPWGRSEEEYRREVQRDLDLFGSSTEAMNAGRSRMQIDDDEEMQELPGVGHMASGRGAAAVATEVLGFLQEVWEAGGWDETAPDRVLATVLFTDIVGSSEQAALLGDRAWRELLERHHAVVRQQLVRFLGREVDTAGDGFFASFDGPARAIRCAHAIVGGVRELGVEVRAGLHTGECEVLGGKVTGIAVHTGARVAAQAQPGEVLVSSTVRDLVAGSGIGFEDRGAHELKGIPGEWRLFAVAGVD